MIIYNFPSSNVKQSQRFYKYISFQLQEPVEKSDFVHWISLTLYTSAKFSMKMFGMGWDLRGQNESSVEAKVPKRINAKLEKKHHCGIGNKANIVCVSIDTSKDTFSQVNIAKKVHLHQNSNFLRAENLSTNYILNTNNKIKYLSDMSVVN